MVKIEVHNGNQTKQNCPDEMPKKIAHLSFIESTIERMANTSSAIKGMSVAILAAAIGIGSFNSSMDLCQGIIFCSFLVSILLIMCALDTFYLKMERRFRNLYELVRTKAEDEIDFSMKPADEWVLSKRETFWHCLCSRSIIFFYLSLIVVSVLTVLFLVL